MLLLMDKLEMFNILLITILFIYLMLKVIQQVSNFNQIIVNNQKLTKVQLLKLLLLCLAQFLKFLQKKVIN